MNMHSWWSVDDIGLSEGIRIGEQKKSSHIPTATATGQITGI